MAETSVASDIYFAYLQGEEKADECLRRVDQIIEFNRSARVWERYRVNYALYYGQSPGSLWSENLRPGGEDGESVDLCINISRQLIRKMLAMITSIRPPMIPKALSTDEGAARKVQIGRGLIEKAMRKLGGYKCADDATEQGLAISAGYVHGIWEDFAGDVHARVAPNEVPEGTRARLDHVLGEDGNPLPEMDESGQPMLDEMGAPQPRTVSTIFKGELKFETLTVKDVYLDPTATSWEDADWFMVRTWRNRWDLATLYPDQIGKILEAKSRTQESFNEWDSQLPTPAKGAFDISFKDDKVLVWYFYHRRRPCIPDGNMALFLDDNTVLEDDRLPSTYKHPPLWRVATDGVIGTALPYGMMNSLGGIQEAFNNLWSAIITNVMAFSRQILWTYKGSGVEYSAIGGGLKLIEVDPGPTGGDPVKSLDLLNVKEELFKVSEMLQGFAVSDVGSNPIAQGDPSGVNAGIAINLFQAMAQQFASPTEAARTDALEGMAMWVLEAYRLHPDMERDVHLVGKDRARALETFYGSDLEGLEEIDIEAGNPMDRTVPGRLQKLQALRELGAPITIEQAMQVLDTGNIDFALEGTADEMTLIKGENEDLAKGLQVTARMGDNHILHLIGHRTVGSNPELRLQDAQMRMEYLQQCQSLGVMPGTPGAPPPPAFPLGPLNAHEMEHVRFWMEGDPVLNAIQGRMPAGPMPPPGMMPMPGAPGAAPGGQPQVPGQAPPTHPAGPHATQGAPPAKPSDPRAPFKPPAPMPVPTGPMRPPSIQ